MCTIGKNLNTPNLIPVVENPITQGDIGGLIFLLLICDWHLI